jgi:hypothetical protein
MILTVLLGGLAGWGAAKAEPAIRKKLDDLLVVDRGLSDVEARVFSLALCLLAAAGVAALADEGNAVMLTLGGVLGVMGPRLLARAKASRT